MLKPFKTLLFGNPIHSKHAEHQKLNVPVGLAVFAADALSSTAYATDEILIALAASSFALSAGVISLPVAASLIVLIALVVFSYRQIINAYPEGGGAYVVSRENLGVTASHIAAASLLIDYVLTVAVSISSGVAQLTSTGLLPTQYTVLTAVLLIALMTLMNLRGVKESGMAIAGPAYVFIAAMAALIGYGVVHVIQHPAPIPLISQVTSFSWGDAGLLFVFLKAFSHGCAGLTGIEAVSNGTKSFMEPRAARANATMLLMGLLLTFIFAGLTFLAFAFHIMPSHSETILSQVSAAVFGKASWGYYAVQFSTTIMLILAANTAFADFPRVTSLVAADGFLPRQFANLGERLVFNNGISVLSVLAIILVIAFGGSTTALIPLYAVGVFLCFTLSQSGMVLYHWRKRHSGWFSGMVINGLGGIVTAGIVVILAAEKFTEGAWIVLVVIPLLVMLFRQVKAHYDDVQEQLALPLEGYCPVAQDHTVLVLVSSLHRGTIPALEYAKTISERVEAVHIEINPNSSARLKKVWNEWGCGIPLTLLKSPYRSITEPIMNYIREVEQRHDKDLVTIIVPEFVTKKWWHYLLHNQTAIVLKTLLYFERNKVVITIRYHLDH